MAIRMTQRVPLGPTERAKSAPARASEPAKPIPVPNEVSKGRGRPASGKTLITLRLDPDVIAKFKATGAGWQARMNECLKQAKV